MSTPVWAPSPWREEEKTHKVALLEVVATGHQIQVKDPEIGQVYLTVYVHAPDMFSLTARFDANGVKSVEVAK